RDFARCWAQRRRSATVKTNPSFEDGLDEAITAVLSVCDTGFVQYYGDWKESFGGSVSSSVRRQRDLFPLPALQSWPLDDTECPTETALAMANLCLASLNVLASDMDPGKAGHGRSTPTVAQQGVHEHVCNRCQLFLRRLRDSGDESFAWRGSFRFFEEKPHAKYPAMKAEAVDLPSAAATCDAVKLLPADLADMIMDPKQLFPAGSQTESWPMGAMGRDRDEYIKLVFRQLQCGKTALRQRCLAVGDVFCVPKSSPGKQREVWNGALVSQAAARPPHPFKLANPGCFVDLCFAEWEEIYMSKRDVHTCFDVLKAPEHLQPWFGRYVADDVKGLTPLLPLYPTSVQEQDFISMDSPPPSGPEICGVATDDTFFFHKDKLVGERRLHQLDAAFDLSGMPKNATKDVTLQQSMTALGCELTSKPPAAEPSAPKLVTLFMALLDVFCVGEASPAGLNRLLGLEQWFCLLSRPMYSIFDSIYEFVRKEPQDRVQPLPSKLRVELVVAAFLAPLLGADLGRRFLPRLIACDASGSFGFGVSYMKCSSSLVKEVSQFSERRGDFVRFFPEEGLEFHMFFLSINGNFAPLSVLEPSGKRTLGCWKLTRSI
ncbi:HET-E1, partial [Symbiodinium necroappetens]